MKDELKVGALEILFSDELYIELGAQQENSIVTEPATTYSKKIASRILVVHKDHSEFSTPDQEFLTKILTAAKVEKVFHVIALKDAQNLNISEESVVTEVLCFGVKPFEIGFQNHTAGNYETQESAGKKVLAIDSLKLISADNNKKKALWIALQRLFNL